MYEKQGEGVMPAIKENRVLKKYSGNATQFTVPEGVTEIGEDAFLGCSNLTQVNIPEGVTVIGRGAFHNCGLTQINIPKSTTEIGEAAFFECRDLTQINIPEGVTEIADMAFCWCYDLTQVNIPKGVTRIGSEAFNGCSSLTQINMPQGLNEIGEMAFYECDSLTQINIPKGVTKIDYHSFYGCARLTQINIPESVLYIIDADAFEKCNQLSYIVVDSDSEIGRVKGLLPSNLRAKVTSFYCEHIANIRAIRRAQLCFLSSKMSLFSGRLNNNISTQFIAQNVYQYLSIPELQLCRSTCKSLYPIRALYYLINEVKFSDDIPTTSDGNTVTKQFLNTPNHREKTLSTVAYKDRLKMFKKAIQEKARPKALPNKQSPVALSLQSPQPKKCRHN